MAPRFPVVLFDLDHTLLDSDASSQAAFDATMQSVGVEPTPEVFAIYDRINQALWRRVEAGSISPNDVKTRRFEQLVDELGVDGDPVAMGATFVQVLTDAGDLYPGAQDLLDTLLGPCRLGMVTNGIGPVQRGRLERLGLTRYFEVVSVSGELAMSKPAPAIFEHTLRQLHVTDRSSVVMVGDSLSSDISGGVAAGIDTIWFNRHGERPEVQMATFEVAALSGVADVVLGSPVRASG